MVVKHITELKAELPTGAQTMTAHWIDQAVVEAANAYIRTAENGGMPMDLSRKVKALIEDMARLNYFSVNVVSAMSLNGFDIVPRHQEGSADDG